MQAISGFHHITLVSSDARRTLAFYVDTLGLRLVKQTVNFDDPSAYHLYFGDENGAPGTLLTFFEWKGMPTGRPGLGNAHHLALRAADVDALLRWKRRLQDRGIRVRGPYNRHYFHSIYFRDPDGAILEIATLGPGYAIAGDDAAPVRAPEALFAGQRDEEAIAAQTWPEPVERIDPAMSLRAGIHHLSIYSADLDRSHDFYAGLLGLERVRRGFNLDDPTGPFNAHWFWGRNGSLTAFAADPAALPPARLGAGQTHHYAFAVQDAQDQLEWREKIIEAGIPVSPVMDRVYFKSIYTRDPDGHIVELATLGPGFAVDEPIAALGGQLRLPPWLEKQRAAIQANLAPLPAPTESLGE